MSNPSGLWLFSPNAPKNSQLFSLGDGSDGALNVPSGTTTIDGFKQYTSVNVDSGATLTCTAETGILIILVQGTVTISGSFNLAGKGYNGGTPTSGYQQRGGGLGSGGGTYGNTDVLPIYLGSGGYGGNGVGGSCPGAGGAGGGALLLVAKKITVVGTISANGANGSGGGCTYPSGGGGGGSGGSIFLVSPEMTLGTNLVTATGGSGGGGGGSGGYGGRGAGYGTASAGVSGVSGTAGGDGRIRLDYAANTGSANPSAHEHGGLRVGYLKQLMVNAGLGQVR